MALCVALAGKVLVRFYGDHSSSWVAQKQLLPWDEADVEHKSAALAVWGKKNNKCALNPIACCRHAVKARGLAVATQQAH